jgi:hypothetical protein
MHPQPCAKFGRALKLSAYRGRLEAEAALPNGAFDPYRKCGGSLLTALCWHLQRPTASVERVPLPQSALDLNQRRADQTREFSCRRNS